MVRSRIKVLLSVIILLTLALSSISSVFAGYSSFEELASSDKKDLVVKIGSAFKEKGYSDAAVSAILGNINQESGFDFTLEENAATVTSQGAGFGLIQWTGGRRTALENFIKDKYNGKNSLEAQVAFFVHETETSHAGVFSRERTGLSNLDSVLDQYYKEKYSSWDDFKKAKDVNSATVAFMAFMEVPGLPHWENRGPIAEGILKNWAKEFTGGTGSSESDKGTVEANLGNNKLPKEWELVGMTKRKYLYESQNKIELPNGDSGLSAKQRQHLASIKEDVTAVDGFNLIVFLRTLVAFVGILFFAWAIFLIVAYLFDRSNIFFEISLVSILTMGSITVMALDESDARRANTSLIIRRVILSLVIGYVLIAGVMYSGLDWLLQLIQSWVSKV